MTQKEFISVCDLNKANVKCIDSFREREKKKNERRRLWQLGREEKVQRAGCQ